MELYSAGPASLRSGPGLGSRKSSGSRRETSLLPEQIYQLKRAVEAQHGGTATFVQSVPVNETFRGNAVWQGIVHVFDLADHALATRAYAWSSERDDGKRRFYAVLPHGAGDGACGGCEGCYSGGAEEVTKWEYEVRTCGSCGYSEAMRRMLAEAGREGWELVAVTEAEKTEILTFFFKRPLGD